MISPKIFNNSNLKLVPKSYISMRTSFGSNSNYNTTPSKLKRVDTSFHWTTPKVNVTSL